MIVLNYNTLPLFCSRMFIFIFLLHIVIVLIFLLFWGWGEEGSREEIYEM